MKKLDATVWIKDEYNTSTTSGITGRLLKNDEKIVLHPVDAPSFSSIQLDENRALLENGREVSVEVENIRYWIWDNEIHIFGTKRNSGCIKLKGRQNYSHYLRDSDSGAKFKLGDTVIVVKLDDGIEYEVIYEGSKFKDAELCSYKYQQTRNCSEKYLAIGFSSDVDIQGVEFV